MCKRFYINIATKKLVNPTDEKKWIFIIQLPVVIMVVVEASGVN